MAEPLKNKTGKSIPKRLCKTSKKRMDEDVVFVHGPWVSNSPTSFFNATLGRNGFTFLKAQNNDTKSSIPSEWSERFWFESGDASLSKTPEDTSTCFQIFTILQRKIASQHKTKWSPMAITQPTRDCAANRSSFSNGVVKLTARCIQIFLPPVKFFSQRKCLCVRLFPESALKSGVTSCQTNCWSDLCSRTSFRLSQHEKFFVFYLGNEI